MRVLLINTFDRGGGAAVAVTRLAESLLRSGAEVRVLTSADLDWRYRVAFFTERLDTLLAVRGRRQFLFKYSTASSGVALADHPWVQWAEVIHLHWVQQGMLSIGGLRDLMSLPGKRVFWTLHDFWPLTGGCHIPYQVGEGGATSFCKSYQTHCGNCPLLGAKQFRDRAYKVFQSKLSLPWERLHLLGVSSAVTSEASLSPLCQHSRVSLLHNPIDRTLFSPAAKSAATEGRLLFVAARLDDPVKGLDYCREVLSRAKKRSRTFAEKGHIQLVGRVKDPRALERFPIPYTVLPYADTATLARLYQQSAVILSTSRYETLGQTLLEGLSCGTPAVAFDVGGIVDMIRPESGNGSLIAPYDLDAMAEAIIRWSLPSYPANPAAIADSVSHFDMESIGKRLMHLYTT